MCSNYRRRVETRSNAEYILQFSPYGDPVPGSRALSVLRLLGREIGWYGTSLPVLIFREKKLSWQRILSEGQSSFQHKFYIFLRICVDNGLIFGAISHI